MAHSLDYGKSQWTSQGHRTVGTREGRGRGRQWVWEGRPRSAQQRAGGARGTPGPHPAPRALPDPEAPSPAGCSVSACPVRQVHATQRPLLTELSPSLSRVSPRLPTAQHGVPASSLLATSLPLSSSGPPARWSPERCDSPSGLLHTCPARQAKCHLAKTLQRPTHRPAGAPPSVP